MAENFKYWGAGPAFPAPHPLGTPSAPCSLFFAGFEGQGLGLPLGAKLDMVLALTELAA